MNTLKEFESETDKFDSLYTFVLHNVDTESVSQHVKGLMDKVGTIKDTVKRKYLNDKLYSMVEWLGKAKIENFNNVVLLGKQIECIDLSKSNIALLKEFKISTIICRNGRQFDIEYLNNLFFDMKLYDVINIQNKQITHVKLNSTKHKKVMSTDSSTFDIQEYVCSNIKGVCLYHGVSSILKGLKYDMVFTRQLEFDEILNEFNKLEEKHIHKKFQELLDMIQNEKKMHLVAFGVDIMKRDYDIKTVFCIKDKLAKVETYFKKKNLSPEIVVLSQLEPGDLFSTLKNDHQGIVGEFYY